MKIYSFEKLDVWKETRKLAGMIYADTSKFPKEEIYGITSQLRRATISVSSNIAEGSGSITGKEQANYYKIAYSSLMETLNQLILSADFNFIEKDKVDYDYRPIIEKISYQLNSLRKAVLNSN